MSAFPFLRFGLAITLSTFVGASLAPTLSAQSVTTDPVGAVQIKIAAAPAGGTKITTFSPSLRLSLGGDFSGKTRGTFTAVSSNGLTDASANWAPGALSQPAAPYFCKINSGSASGAIWQISTSTSNSATSVTVISLGGKDPVTAGVTTGDSYEIIPADTLSTLFGGIESQIGGSNIDNADNVRIHDGASWRVFYFNSVANQWREGSSSFNRNNIIVRPNSGVIYTRRGQSELNLFLTGNVVTNSEKFVVTSTGASFIGGVYPVDRQLVTLGLNTFPGFVINTGNLDQADKVRFFDGTSWRVMSYNGTQWREGTSSFNRNTLIVPAGTPVIVERGAGATGSSVLASIPVPYTL